MTESRSVSLAGAEIPSVKESEIIKFVLILHLLPSDIIESDTYYRILIMTGIDTSDMCSHLYEKLFSEDGEYRRIWLSMQDDPEITAVVRNRQLHVYRSGKKIMILAGKAGIKVLREDPLTYNLNL